MSEVEVIDSSKDPVSAVSDEINQAYKAVSDSLFAFVDRGEVNVFNFDEILKEVMEAVEALGNVTTLSGTQKGQLAQDFSIRVINDLHERGKISDDFFNQASSAMKYVGPSVFTAITLASKGKILINQAVDAIEKTKCYQKHCGSQSNLSKRK